MSSLRILPPATPADKEMREVVSNKAKESQEQIIAVLEEWSHCAGDIQVNRYGVAALRYEKVVNVLYS